MRNKDKDSYKKFLFVISVIQKNSDENHQLTTQDIIQFVEKSSYNFQVNTKAIKRYIDDYNDIFQDHIIVNKVGRKNYYYFAGTSLDIMEAKAIMDLIYSSDFFTQFTKDNYKERIKAIFSLNYQHYFDKKINLDIKKNANDVVFYSELEKISDAIYRKKMIHFIYCKPSLSQLNKKEVTIAPIDTHFYNNVYYLICQGNKNKEEYVTYRLDYISNVSIVEDSSVIITHSQIKGYEEKLYQMTYMYQEGNAEYIELEFEECVYSNIIDKFGKNINAYPSKEGYYKVQVKNIINSTFYSWLIGFNGKIQICGNSNQVEKFNNFLKTFIRE